MKIGLKNTGLLHEKIDRDKVSELIEEIVGRENRKLGEIEVIFLDDREILEINKQFLRHNYFTDVITFSYNRKDIISGDICISIDSVSRNSLRFNSMLYHEIMRVIIHGVLHLIGYDDRDSGCRKKMKAKENFYMKMTLNKLNE